MSTDNSTKIKILLADDDSSMRRFLEITLQRSDYEVISAEDGLAAMKIALTENFDVVLADAVMPNMTGHDLCRMLRQNPNYKEALLIILSGLEHDVSSGGEQDCADLYMVKSSNLKDELKEILAKYASEKSK